MKTASLIIALLKIIAEIYSVISKGRDQAAENQAGHDLEADLDKIRKAVDGAQEPKP